ncbi:MAG: hypothetical protein ACR2OI_09075 [Acidimicrobiia bacterium]
MSSSGRFRIKTGLGRILHIEHRSNRYAISATLLAGAGTLLWRASIGADEPWMWSVRIAAAVFLAWAIGRELDPDHPGTGALASLVVIPFAALGALSVAASVAALLAARIAVRTTGFSPHWWDGAILTAGAAYLGARPETWPALGMLLLAVGTDRYAEPPGPTRTLWFGAAMTVVSLATAVAFSEPSDWTQPTIPEWIVFAVTAVCAFLAIGYTRAPRSQADWRPEKLSETRLRYGRVLALFTLAVGIIFLGGPVIPTLAPLWAAASSVAVMHWYRRAMFGTTQPPM